MSRRQRRGVESLTGRGSITPEGTAPFLLPLVLVVLATTTAPTAEAGSIGSSQAVPWWYPSRLWGMDQDGGGGWGSYYAPEGGGFWRKKRRSREGGAGSGGAWPYQDPYVRWHKMETADLAREFVEDCVARGLGEEEERAGHELQCSVHEAGNATLRRLGDSLNRCASPYYSLTEIYPSQLVYMEPDPALEAARFEEEARRSKAAWARQVEEAESEDHGEGRLGGGDDARPDEGEPEHERSFLGIFLFLKGDFFSIELESALTAVAPAYPGAWMVKANAKTFLSFCVQYHLYTFPQLLLFKNGRLVSNFRGRRTVQDLAYWLSRQTGELPRALPRRALPIPPVANPLSFPGPDEPLTWVALLYAAIKVFGAFSWLVKRRARGVAGDTEAGGGRGGVVGWAKRLGRWVISLVSTKQGRRGQGRRRVVR